MCQYKSYLIYKYWHCCEMICVSWVLWQWEIYCLEQDSNPHLRHPGSVRYHYATYHMWWHHYACICSSLPQRLVQTTTGRWNLIPIFLVSSRIIIVGLGQWHCPNRAPVLRACAALAVVLLCCEVLYLTINRIKTPPACNQAPLPSLFFVLFLPERELYGEKQIYMDPYIWTPSFHVK